MSWWSDFFRRRALDKQLESELRFHVEEVTEANINAGMPAEEARRQALLEFGGREQIKEELREVHRIGPIESMMSDFKAALRFIRRSPGFSAAMILTLALGIGANSAVFSAVDAVLLRPLPFPHGDQLMQLSQEHTKVKDPMTRVAPARLEDWNRSNVTFQAITGYYTENSSETSGPLPEKLKQAFVAPRFLQVWEIFPALGRDFSAEEQRSGGPNAALISNRLWRRRFGGDPNTLGQKLNLNGFVVSIVGVMPANFQFPDPDVDVWSPVPTDSPYAQNRESTWYLVIGRLKPGATLEQARANLATVQAQLGSAYPKTDVDMAVVIEPLKEVTVADSRKSLWMLFGSVSLLLLIACTNIVTLLLSRGAGRLHEISVRISLGASRRTIVRQLMTETFVLVAAGAAVGLLIAQGAAKVFGTLAASLPRVNEIRLDWRIVAYALTCTAVVTFLCGLAPALRSTRLSIAGSLAQSSRTQVSGRNTLQYTLVGVQVALAITLLASAGLLLRTFQELGRVQPGFQMNRVLTFHVSGSYAETTDYARLTQRLNRTIDGLRTIPGVEDAATSLSLPSVPWEYPTELQFHEGERDERKMTADSRFVQPSYFSTLQIPLLAGQVCRQPVLKSGPTGAKGESNIEFESVQVMVNRSFAEAYSGGSRAVGRHIHVIGKLFQGPSDNAEIRGIVGDARERGLNHNPEPTIYWCMDGEPTSYFLVRTKGEPKLLAETIRQKIHELEPARSVFDIDSLANVIGTSFSENRLRTILLTFFAATAIALACVGLYGTLSYSVNCRQREIGLRLALGAAPRRILAQFLSQGLSVTIVGCLGGAALTAAGVRLLAEMLYGVSPWDPETLAGVFLLVLAVGTLASFIPAMRAARVDPMRVLREE